MKTQMNKRTTFNIEIEKKMMLERAAIEISHKIRKPVKWTELLNFMIENYTKDAMQDIIHKAKENNES